MFDYFGIRPVRSDGREKEIELFAKTFLDRIDYLGFWSDEESPLFCLKLGKDRLFLASSAPPNNIS